MRFRVIVPVVLLTGAATAAAILIGWRMEVLSFGSAESRVRGLGVSGDALCFGEVWVQREFQHTLPLENTTNRSIRVVGVSAGCDCTSVHPTEFVIGPKSKRDVTLTVDLIPRTEEDATIPRREFSTAIIIPWVDNGNHHRSVWKLHGQIRSAIVLSRPGIDFGETMRGESYGQEVVRARPLTSIQQLRGHCDQAEVTIERCPNRLDEFQIGVRPHATSQLGQFSFDVDLSPITQNGERLPSYPLRITGVVVGDTQVTPNEVRFSAASVGEILEETVVLGPRKGAKCTISSIRCSADDLTVEPVKWADALGKETHAYRVRQAVTQAGDQTNSVTFTVHEIRRGKEEVTEYVLPVRYHGLE